MVGVWRVTCSVGEAVRELIGRVHSLWRWWEFWGPGGGRGKLDWTGLDWSLDDWSFGVIIVEKWETRMRGLGLRDGYVCPCGDLILGGVGSV